MTLRFDDFYRKYEGRFLAKSEGRKYFFRFLPMFKVKLRPKKSTFQISKTQTKKNRLKFADRNETWKTAWIEKFDKIIFIMLN